MSTRTKPAERKRKKRRRISVGWREWISLRELGVDRIKAKVDTGARTSALHAFDVETFERDGVAMARFRLHPIQRDFKVTVDCEAPLVGHRHVRSSTGGLSWRPVIRTSVALGGLEWPIELTLIRRDAMGFRMLLGRQATRGRCVVHPGRSFIAGTP